MHTQNTTSLEASPASTLALVMSKKGDKPTWNPHLVRVLDVEWLARCSYMSHNALVPLQPDAATGGFFQRGSLGHVKQPADQELSVGAVLTHLGHTHTHIEGCGHTAGLRGVIFTPIIQL